MKLLKYKKIHFIGINGIGLSAAADLALSLGKQVSGSDIESSDITKKLKKRGAKIYIGTQKASQVAIDTQLVVYSNAVKKNNPELKRAKQLKITAVSYPEFLGELMNGYLPLIVTGTHGKSSTTAMLARIFIAAGLDPTVVVGTKVREFDGNAHFGLGRYFIAEGDEYMEAFVNYQPIGLIINNIEADHLDYYKSLANIIKSFKKIVQKVPKGGFLVINDHDQNIKKILKATSGNIISYGLDQGDYRATHIVQYGELTRFAVKGLERFDLAIRVPGQHNVLNALAAAVMALSFGIEIQIIQKALLSYQGVWRRFEFKGRKNGITVIDDYAHHPTEIKATLETARHYFPNKKIWCVFQPHSGNRTKTLYKDFLGSFDNCDKLVLTDIYKVAGRENEKIPEIKKMAREIKMDKKEIYYQPTLSKVINFLKRNVKKGEVVITMGAGDITLVSDKLIK